MNEWNDIVIFEKNNASRCNEKTITLYQTTAKTINMAFNSLMTKGIEEDYITLAYSKQKNAIVIFLSKENPNHAYKLSKRSRGCTISIQKFLNFFNLDKKDVLGKYFPEEDIIDDKFCWLIYLKKELLNHLPV